MNENRIDTHLAAPGWLESHLGDPQVRVIDMRGYVVTDTNADGVQTAIYKSAREDYSLSHIPGAVYVDWTTDIVDTDDTVPAQVAGEEKAARVFSMNGIGDDTVVVAYDNHPASQFATRLWWVLKYYGHKHVRVLNGGWNRWRREGRPVSSEVPRPSTAKFTPRRNPRLRTESGEVAAILGTEVQLLDARDEGQFSGRIRRGPRGGHIPGAVNLPRELLIDEEGSWRDPSELAAVFDSRDVTSDREVVAYCNGGVAATSVLFALSMLGYSRLSNYDGSWNEWSAKLDLPVSEGDSP